MPANEQTWRSTKLLHMVFGLSALALLLVTLWMFSADHNREWKRYQEDFFFKVETWNLLARRHEQENATYVQGTKVREFEIERQQSELPSPLLLDLYSLEQTYFHNRDQLEPTAAGSAAADSSAARSAPASGAPATAADYATGYAALLNEIAGLLKAETASAETDVRARLLRDDQAHESDPQRRETLGQGLKELEAQAARHRQELTTLRARVAQLVKDFQGKLAALPLANAKPPEVQAVDAARQDLAQLTPSTATQPSVENRPAAEKRPAADQRAAGADEISTDVDKRRTDARRKLLDLLANQIKAAAFQEEKVQTDLKARRGVLEDVRSGQFDLPLGQGASPSALQAGQEEVHKVLRQVAELEAQYNSLSRHRKQLDAVVAAIRAGETEARKAQQRHQEEVLRLKDQWDQALPSVGKTILGMPILDAFYNSPQIGLKDKQRWLPELTIDRNFNAVARYDRCESCHLGLLKAVPGDALSPAYEKEQTLSELSLSTARYTSLSQRHQAGATDVNVLAGLLSKGRWEGKEVPVMELLARHAAVKTAREELEKKKVLRRPAMRRWPRRKRPLQRLKRRSTRSWRRSKSRSPGWKAKLPPAPRS